MKHIDTTIHRQPNYDTNHKLSIYISICLSIIINLYIYQSIYLAGVVAHLASDGAKAWTMQTPKREQVLGRMVRAIMR